MGWDFCYGGVFEIDFVEYFGSDVDYLLLLFFIFFVYDCFVMLVRKLVNFEL